MNLTTNEVKGILTGKDAEQSIGELDRFGMMLLHECLDRAQHVDAKATTLAGYAGVILTLMVTGLSSGLEAVPSAALGVLIAGWVCVVVAAGLAVSVLSLRRHDWFSDEDWLAPTVIANPVRLRQAHLVALHSYKHQHEAVNAQKSTRLRWAFRMLGVGLVCLAGALATSVVLVL